MQRPDIDVQPIQDAPVALAEPVEPAESVDSGEPAAAELPEHVEIDLPEPLSPEPAPKAKAKAKARAKAPPRPRTARKSTIPPRDVSPAREVPTQPLSEEEEYYDPARFMPAIDQHLRLWYDHQRRREEEGRRARYAAFRIV